MVLAWSRVGGSARACGAFFNYIIYLYIGADVNPTNLNRSSIFSCAVRRTYSPLDPLAVVGSITQAEPYVK